MSLTLGGAKTKFNHVDSQPCLHDRAPVKTLDTGSGELPERALLCACCHTLLLGELRAVSVTPSGQDNWRLVPGLSRTLPWASSPFAEFNLHPFAVMKCSHAYNSFSEFCES